MPERRPGEVERHSRWIALRAHVIPVQDVLAERGIPPGSRRPQSLAGEALRGGISVGVERRLPVPRIAGPPADLYLLCGPGVAHDEIVGGRVSRPPGKQA